MSKSISTKKSKNTYSGGRHVTVQDFWVFEMLREKSRENFFTMDHPGGLVSFKKCSAGLEK
jgi:hypothetical protein